MSWSESQNRLLTLPRLEPDQGLLPPAPDKSQGPTLHEHAVLMCPSRAAGTLEMTWFCIGKHAVSPLSPELW